MLFTHNEILSGSQLHRGNSQRFGDSAHSRHHSRRAEWPQNTRRAGEHVRNRSKGSTSSARNSC